MEEGKGEDDKDIGKGMDKMKIGVEQWKEEGRRREKRETEVK